MMVPFKEVAGTHPVQRWLELAKVSVAERLLSSEIELFHDYALPLVQRTQL